MKNKLNANRLGVLLALVALTSLKAIAQAPAKMSYQAVVRDFNGNLLVSKPVGIKISLLRGSANGTAVFVEAHTASANANGLVSLEIGGGNATMGTFASVDWATGPYYIKTETDPTGGMNYTIVTSNQLLSVPYALYAANTGTPGPQGPKGDQGLKGEQGPKGDTGPAGKDGESKKQIISRSGLIVTLSDGGGSFKDSVNVYTAGPGITINGNTISASDMEPRKFAVGDIAQGGIVFYVNASGTHGLVAANTDQSTDVNFFNSRNEVSDAANFDNAGKRFTDWRVPTKHELNLMYTALHLNGKGSFAAAEYWTSIESNLNFVVVQNFGNGNSGSNNKNNNARLRAVRSF
jgi:hypothetical protein